MSNVIIGIDPGLSGAIAAMYQDKDDVVIVDTPTIQVKSGKKSKNEYLVSSMVKSLKELTDGHSAKIYLEKVHAMPGQGVVSQFNFGIGFGLWVGIISALEIPVELIAPQTWKKAILSDMGKDKSASVLKASQLYPNADLFGVKGGAKDGRGDAICMAEYGKRIHGFN